MILPVATASVERVFSTMALIKTDLRSKMVDDWMNHLMICYIEKEIFRSISNGKIIQRFEEMKKCRMLVPRVCSIRFNISFYFELLICQLSPIYYVGIQNAPREDPQSS